MKEIKSFKYLLSLQNNARMSIHFISFLPHFYIQIFTVEQIKKLTEGTSLVIQFDIELKHY